MKMWSDDFETTTDTDDCRVWLWGSVPADNQEKFTWGTNIDEYIEHLSDVGGRHSFHNLEFDGAFILSWLETNGWTHVRQLRGRGNTYTTLISREGKFYSITLQFPRTPDRKGRRVQIVDSLKKLPMPVAKVAQAFGGVETKGTLDYTKRRPPYYMPTWAELDYLRRDCVIIAHALKVQEKSGMKKLTVGSDALTDYQKLIGGFRDYFPLLDSSIDNDIRAAYRGGFTYVNPKYQNKVVGPGASYDVNSLYPYIMYDRQLPYGVPEYFPHHPTSNDEYPLWIARITLEAKLKPGKIPTLQVKNTPGYVPTQYVEETDGAVDLAMTNVDYELLCENYDVDIVHWGGGWKFRAVSGLFRSYIDKWMDVKINSSGGIRAIAKLMLNSLYGKFATNPDVTSRIPELDENNVIRLVLSYEEMREPVYTAMGVFITAYARDYTIRSAGALGDRFIYADTDSLHILGHDPIHLRVDPNALGAWKHEYDFTRGKYVRAKCYVEQLSDDTKDVVVRVAGLPENARDGITVDTLNVGATFKGKLRPLRVPGGIVLVPVDYVIR